MRVDSDTLLAWSAKVFCLNVSRRRLNDSLNTWKQGQTCSFKIGGKWSSSVVGMHLRLTRAFDFTLLLQTDCLQCHSLPTDVRSQNAANPNLNLILSPHIISEVKLPVFFFLFSFACCGPCCLTWLTAHVSAAHYLTGTALQGASWLSVMFMFFWRQRASFNQKTNNLQLIFIPIARCVVRVWLLSPPTLLSLIIYWARPWQGSPPPPVLIHRCSDASAGRSSGSCSSCSSVTVLREWKLLTCLKNYLTNDEGDCARGAGLWLSNKTIKLTL